MPTYDSFCRPPLVDPAFVTLPDSAVHLDGRLDRLVREVLGMVDLKTLTVLDAVSRAELSGGGPGRAAGGLRAGRAGRTATARRVRARTAHARLCTRTLTRAPPLPAATTRACPQVCDVLRPDGGQLVVLIKPQFEAGKAQVGWGRVGVYGGWGGSAAAVCRGGAACGRQRCMLPLVLRTHCASPPLLPCALAPSPQVSAGGVVRDPAVHREVVERVVGALAARGFACRGWRPSPIKGATSGNTEFLAYFVRQGAAPAAAAAGNSDASSDAAAAEGAAAAAAAAAAAEAGGAAAAGAGPAP